MGQLDRNNLGTPVGSYKRDWTLYVGGGLGGGSTATATGTTRYTFWIDHSKFMTFLRKLITQNVSFDIYTNSGLGTKVPVYVGVSQSNDITDEAIRAQGLYIDPNVTPTPYFINTTFLTQPTDFSYQNDQGRYVYDAYSGNGLGLGNSGKIVQEFVPQSPFLTAVWLNRLFRVGSTSDHTLYNDIIVEIWDTNKNVIGTSRISKYANQFLTHPEDNNVEYYVTADDGLQYWIDLDEVRFKFNPYVKVIPGSTHYICIKQDTSSVAHHYGVGSNTNSGGTYNGNGKYIFGAANTATYTGTALTPVGTDIDVCFVTQRNNGRTAITFLWDSSSYYWYNPDTFDDQFRFVKEDSDRRI